VVTCEGAKEKPRASIYIGDCRQVLATLPQAKAHAIDLIFADPPFNWNRGYDRWNDSMEHEAYLAFTYEWLDLCIQGLRAGGALWVNIPDDWAAEIAVHLKKRNLTMRNWCVWHYRFGQNTTERFINSKVHALYFEKPGGKRTWNAKAVLELSDRASTYFDSRTLQKKDGMPPGHRVPLDVWYGTHFGRVQGNSKERRNYHDNQLPEAYLHRVISACSHRGDLVLDPFLGSGTTGVMARALGREFVGIEYSPLNAANALARIEAGPVRSYDKPESSAIFKPRATTKATRAKMASSIAAKEE
jgi:DNA modification methylase